MSTITPRASSFCIVGVGEKTNVFTNLGPSQYKKPRKLEWELMWVFQNICTTKLPWAKVVVGLNGKLSKGRCKIYINVKKCEKNFVPKFGGL